MNNKLKTFLIFIAVVILSFILAPYFGRLFEIIIGQNITSWGSADAEKFEGFMIVFAFLSGVLFFGLLNKNRVNITLPFMVVFPIMAILDRAGELFLVSLGFGLIGLGLGQLVYLIRKKVSKSKK